MTDFEWLLVRLRSDEEAILALKARWLRAAVHLMQTTHRSMQAQ